MAEDPELSGVVAEGAVPLGDGCVVVAFDLDGTLTRRDTLLPFLLRAFGPERTARAVLASSPRLARAAAQGGAHRDASKAEVLRRLLTGEPLERLAALADDYAADVVGRRLRPGMRARVDWHRGEAHTLVLVSASPELYVSGIGRRLGFDAVLATRLEVGDDGRLTGRLLGANCRGPEKVARLREWLGGDPVLGWAYGDSTGDREMLAVAATPVLLRRRRPVPSRRG